MAGSVSLASDIINRAINEVSGEDIHKVTEAFQRYVDEWKQKEENQQKEFTSTLGIFGWDELQQPVATFVGKGGRISKETVPVIASGSGSRRKVYNYLVTQVANSAEIKEEHYGNLLKRCLAMASIDDAGTGGFVSVAKMPREGGVKFATEEDHVIQILAAFYEELKVWVENCLILATINLKYTFDNENMVKNEVCKQLEGVSGVHVLGVHNKGNLTVRVIKFVDVSRADKALGKRKHFKLPDDEAAADKVIGKRKRTEAVADKVYVILVKPTHKMIREKISKFFARKKNVL